MDIIADFISGLRLSGWSSQPTGNYYCEVAWNSAGISTENVLHRHPTLPLRGMAGEFQKWGGCKILISLIPLGIHA
jgi:hypothetical protein